MKYGGQVWQDIQQHLKRGTSEEWDAVIFYFLLHKFQVLYKNMNNSYVKKILIV